MLARTTESLELPLFVGVDVGGSSIKLGVVDEAGRALGHQSLATEQQRGPQDAVDRIAAALRGLVQRLGIDLDSIAAVGLGTPGTMDLAQGVILEPPNLPAWRHFPIRDALSRACGKPVTYGNDAGAAAYGEYWVGRGRDASSLVLFTLGTGVGGGIIVDGLSIDGAHSHGSECGHVVVDTGCDARQCSCGLRGHLEAYASGTAVAKICAERMENGESSSLAELLDSGSPIDALAVYEHAERGDALCLAVVDSTADYLARGIAIVAHIIDPQVVLLGGAVNFGGPEAATGRRFLQRVGQQVQGSTFPTIARELTIDFAQLAGDAGWVGAAGMARAEFHRRKRNSS